MRTDGLVRRIRVGSLQQRYYDILLERIREERYPSHQMLNRIEASLWTPEQMEEYVATLLEKIDESWYPSPEFLSRVERVMLMVAMAG
jgi:hypothetical protein